MQVKTAIEGKTKDVAITDVTPENYIVPSNEQHLYHCVIEVRKFDSETGKRLSVPRIQKFGKKSFENGILDALKNRVTRLPYCTTPTSTSRRKPRKKRHEPPHSRKPPRKKPPPMQRQRQKPRTNPERKSNRVLNY